jgi:GDP-mannose 6-dehydrogenase
MRSGNLKLAVAPETFDDSSLAPQRVGIPSISVIGLGYVGAVSVACFSKRGHRVVGVDLDERKVDLINQGRGPLVEKDLDEYLTEGVGEGRVTAMTSALGAIMATDVTFVCVGTPSSEDGSVNLGALKAVARDMGLCLKAMDRYHLVVVRSTIPAGTTRTVFLPEVERISGKKVGVDFGLCFHPEFLREGVAIADFFAPPKTVIGAYDEESGKRLAALYDGIEAPLCFTSIEAAEMVKYVDNTWHAVKVAFANEIGKLCKAMDVDSHDVMNIFVQDKKLNLSPYYLKPGFAFGGSCLPKDVRGMSGLARRNGTVLPLVESLLPSNDGQLEHAYKLIRTTGRRKVGVLGITFKSGTDDLRESPIIELIGMLCEAGVDVKVYDPNIKRETIAHALEYMKTASATTQAAVKGLASMLTPSAEQLVADCDLVVAAHNTMEFCNALLKAAAETLILDLVRLPEPVRALPGYEGICW